jgi:hypothetical protein
MVPREMNMILPRSRRFRLTLIEQLAQGPTKQYLHIHAGSIRAGSGPYLDANDGTLCL